MRDPLRKVNSGPVEGFARGDLNRSLSRAKRYSFERFSIFAEALGWIVLDVEIEGRTAFFKLMFHIKSSYVSEILEIIYVYLLQNFYLFIRNKAFSH